MALCPECGGHVSPRRLLTLRPGNGVRCPWCRAQVGMSRRMRLLIDFLLVALGAVAVSWLGALFLDSGDPLFLVYLGGCGVGLILVILLCEVLCELETRVPRDHRDWKATEPEQEG